MEFETALTSRVLQRRRHRCSSYILQTPLQMFAGCVWQKLDNRFLPHAYASGFENKSVWPGFVLIQKIEYFQFIFMR